eukprot:CAMPEP_0182572004 /NCGR_PEP_ID=MMETSP1324-20130603/15740_1 /TAXON_ID=236786 /ORGANISM="Florenciella sp., Strain RCC1587" /LENGTH=262 /DNA_ID=CAMNT_0024786785 /DNA_START=1 /DNA_END=790 /DNA_ORIENTATION=+
MAAQACAIIYDASVGKGFTDNQNHNHDHVTSTPHARNSACLDPAAWAAVAEDMIVIASPKVPNLHASVGLEKPKLSGAEIPRIVDPLNPERSFICGIDMLVGIIKDEIESGTPNLRCQGVSPDEFFSAEDGCICVFRIHLSFPQHATLDRGLTAAARAVFNPLTKLITRIDYVVDTQAFESDVHEMASENSMAEGQGTAAGSRVAAGGEGIRSAASALASAPAAGWSSVPPLPSPSLDRRPTDAPDACLSDLAGPYRHQACD